MCGQGLNPFTTRSGRELQDLLKDNNNIYNTGFWLQCLSQFGGLLLLTELAYAVLNRWRSPYAMALQLI